MNKKLAVALAVSSAFFGSASAQSSVTIFGVSDVSLTSVRSGPGTSTRGGGIAVPGTSVSRVDSGVGPGSRLGFRGVEGLGGDLQAVFHLESGFDTSTGVSQQLGVFWGRQVFVGLRTKSWSLTAGRQLSPMAIALGTIDPMNGTYWGNFSVQTGHGVYASIGEAGGSGFDLATNRVDNSLEGSFTYGPVTGRLMVALGNENARNTGRLINPSLQYSNGPLTVAASYTSFNQGAGAITATATPEKLSEAFFGVSYSDTWGKIGAGIYRTAGPKNLAQLTPGFTNFPAPGTWDSSRTAFIGASKTFGPHRVAADLSFSTYNYPNNMAAGKSTNLGAVYEYYFSKRTNLYLSGGVIKNNSTSRTPLFGTTIAQLANGYGSRVSAISLGMRHQF